MCERGFERRKRENDGCDAVRSGGGRRKSPYSASPSEDPTSQSDNENEETHYYSSCINPNAHLAYKRFPEESEFWALPLVSITLFIIGLSYYYLAKLALTAIFLILATITLVFVTVLYAVRLLLVPLHSDTCTPCKWGNSCS